MLDLTVKIIRYAIALIFIVTSILKFLNISSFNNALISFGTILGVYFPSIVFYAFSVILLLAELSLGIFLLLDFKFAFTISSLFLLTLSFIFTNLVLIMDGKIKECFCFGDLVESSPQSSLLIDFVILIFLIVLVKLNPPINKNIYNET